MARQAVKAKQVKTALNYAKIVIFSSCSALVCTVLARSGADGWFPWGILVSLFLTFLVALASRKRQKMPGLGTCLAFSSAVAWTLGIWPGMGQSVLVPVASPAFTTFFSKWAGYAWLFGMIAVQVIAAFLPKKWFLGKK